MRAIVTTAQGTPIKELLPDRVLKLDAVHEINGEHSLTLQTLDFLEKQQRVLVQDPNTRRWHEYVVLGIDEEHEDAGLFINTYYCVESWQYELAGTVLKSQPGKNSPVNATAALTAALAGSRWSVGTVEPTTLSGASFYYLSGYEALGLVVQNWGGEVDATVTISGSQVGSRRINLLNHLGSSDIVDIFEYARNVSGIKRIAEDAPFTCRIIPRGAAIESDSGGYGRKIGIANVNPTGQEYLENSDIVDQVKLPNGSGYVYPTQVVEYPDIEDPQLLYDTALADLPKYTTPQISYEVSVLNIEGWQLAENQRISALKLGDAVAVIDHEYPGGLKLTGRVTRLDANYLDTRYNVATIGFGSDGLPGEFAGMQKQLDGLGNWRDLLQGALAASDTGKLTTTSDLTVGGTILTIGNASNTDYDALQFKTKNYTSLGIRAYDNGTIYGHEMLIQSGAGMIIGSGEYPKNRYDVGDIRDSEVLYLGSDAQVYIETNGNSIANRKTFAFGNGGDLWMPKDGRVWVDSSVIDINATSQASRVTTSGITLRDKNENVVGNVYAEQLANGATGFLLSARRGSTYNAISLRVANDGTREVYVDAPAEWRKALGLSYAAGDSYTIPSSTPQLSCAGMLTSGNTALYFFVPLEKPIDATSATISGNIAVRTPTGYIYPTAAATSSYNFPVNTSGITQGVNIAPNGVWVTLTTAGWVTNSSGAAASANRNATVALLSGFKITFA